MRSSVAPEVMIFADKWTSSSSGLPEIHLQLRSELEDCGHLMLAGRSL